MEAGGVRVRPVPGFLPKTATPYHLGQDIFLPELEANDKLCVKRALTHYISRTKDCAQVGEQRLFVTFAGKDKGKAASKRTISGWLVRTMNESYKLMGVEPPSAAQACSTRAIATSTALFNGASIMEVMKAADWRTSQTFARHYGLDLWKQRAGQFGRAVLLPQKD